MSEKLQKLELTWPGKDERFNPEPRILLEDTSKSYSKEPTEESSVKPTFDNMLIHGDNLLALKALEQDYTGQVKCIYIDPPFNTGSAFEHYDDGLEHSIWLSLMRDRLEILRKLLCEDGVIFVNLDDSESAYMKVLMDEIFGRSNYINEIIVATNKAFGFKGTSDGLFKQANHIFLYAKQKDAIRDKLNEDCLLVEKGYDTAYNMVFENTSEPENNWKWSNIKEIVSKEMGYTSYKEAKNELGEKELSSKIAEFAIKNADRVFQAVGVSGGAFLKRKETIAYSHEHKNMIVRHPNDDMDYMFIGGRRVIFYKERLKNIDGKIVPAEMVTDIWMDISIEGLAKEGGVDFPKGKKPEKLLQRCIAMYSNPGDLVLDSFLGSGTTCAVAHKMGRRWIGVEMGNHVYTHCIPRLTKVINGEDQGGITKATGWKNGGGFKFYELASSLIVKDRYGQQVISDKYNADMLAEAMCKILDYHYKPDKEKYWKQGFSSEKSFIYTTTMSMQETSLSALAEEVGDNNLLICCSAFRGNTNAYPNISVKKIPAAILKKCEWGATGYPFQLKDYHPKAEDFEFDEEE